MEIDARACVVDDVLLERYTYGPGHADPTPVHVHDTYQWCLCLGAVGQYKLRGNHHTFPSGTLTVVHPGEPHSAHDPYERRERSTCLVAYVPVATTARVAGMDEPYFPGPIVDRPAASRQFARAWAAAIADERLEFDSLLLALLKGASDGGQQERETRAVSVAREHLHEHAVDRVRLDHLASVVGLSPTHLVRAFSQAVGMPPHRYQTWLRIERAKRLLVADDIAIGKVALAAGFHDHPHFSRTFRRWVGVTPSRYGQVAKNVQDKGP